MNVANTLSLEAAMHQAWDVVVVGAGPAGTLAARELSRSGLKTLLVDRKSFPRTKICGACLNQRTLSVLREVNLESLVQQADPIPIKNLLVNTSRQSVSLNLPGGIVLSRTRLDEMLLRAAIESGTEFLARVTATLDDLTDCQERRRVILKTNDAPEVVVTGRLVVLADGLSNSALQNYPLAKSRSAPESRVGIGGLLVDPPQDFETGRIYMAVSQAGYVGLVLLEDGNLNIAAALNTGDLKQHDSPAALIQQILNKARFPELNQLNEVKWTGTVPLTRGMQKPTLPRTILCGDAAGYVEPFTGEGVSSALTGGLLASSLISERIAHWDRSAEEEWGRLYHQKIRHRYRWCSRLARVSRHSIAVELALSAVRIFPWLAQPVITHLNDPVKPVAINS
ncbi:MAG: NAD(P)/FAD-dependent oxidoreductase [Planctomycetaceae bacterium]|nr:NAD(P)/FAD-dependent oxidoreductase [Planctomycetaceae bacterium]